MLESLNIGKPLGYKVILIGVSTGATLTTWLAAQDDNDIHAMVMISPNFWPRSTLFQLLQYDAVTYLAELLGAGTYEWQPVNEGHAKFWTHSMPISALQPMVRLVAEVDSLELGHITAPVIMLYSPSDSVINPNVIAEKYHHFGSQFKAIHQIDTEGMLSNHVIAGDILSPNLTPVLQQWVIDFINTL